MLIKAEKCEIFSGDSSGCISVWSENSWHLTLASFKLATPDTISLQISHLLGGNKQDCKCFKFDTGCLLSRIQMHPQPTAKFLRYMETYSFSQVENWFLYWTKATGNFVSSYFCKVFCAFMTSFSSLFPTLLLSTTKTSSPEIGIKTSRLWQKGFKHEGAGQKGTEVCVGG